MSPLHEMVMNIGRHKLIMFTVISLLAVSLIYSLSSTFYVYAVPADSRFDSAADCKGEVIDGEPAVTCCWREKIPGSVLGEVYCQSCFYGSGGDRDCDPKELQMRPLPEGDLPQLETVPPIRTLPGDVGDLPTLEQVPGPGLSQGTEGEPPLPVVCSAGLELDEETGQCVPIEPGGLPQLEQVPPNGILPGGGDIPTLEPGPGFTQGTEGEPPLPVVCSEEAGLEKDPENGQCVPIEEPITEQPEEAPEEESEEDQSEPEEEQPAEESGSGDGSNN